MSPSIASIAAAGANASALSASNFNIVDGPGARTYPLANFSWTLLYQRQTSSSNGLALGRLLDWIATTGQRNAAALGYAPLPANAAALTHSTLLQLQSSTGSPLFSS